MTLLLQFCHLQIQNSMDVRSHLKKYSSNNVLIDTPDSFDLFLIRAIILSLFILPPGCHPLFLQNEIRFRRRYASCYALYRRQPISDMAHE